MALETWFALLALFLVGGLTPGPAVMLTLSSSLRFGFWPAMRVALGVASANVFWLALAASGAAALAANFPAAFTGLKLVGLLVILWLGVGIMRAPPFNASMSTEQSGGGLYLKGLALQISNPLALVTFAGILPAFFDTSRPIFAQFLIMIGTLTALELFGLAVYAGFGRAISDWLQAPKRAKAFNITLGAVMIAAGISAIVFTV
ncbi:MAG: LysE family translocator [Robiginitomaculum sp.]